MTDTTSAAQRRLDRRLVVAGAALTGAGTIAGGIGITLLTVAAGRGWARRLDLPPRELAKFKWHQITEASRAGAEAWRKTTPSGDRQRA